MDDSDFCLCQLSVTFKDGDVFWVGGDCAAFEEDERMCVVAFLLKIDEAERFVGHLVGEAVRMSCGCAARGGGGGSGGRVRCYKI